MRFFILVLSLFMMIFVFPYASFSKESESYDMYVLSRSSELYSKLYPNYMYGMYDEENSDSPFDNKKKLSRIIKDYHIEVFDNNAMMAYEYCRLKENGDKIDARFDDSKKLANAFGKVLNIPYYGKMISRYMSFDKANCSIVLKNKNELVNVVFENLNDYQTQIEKYEAINKRAREINDDLTLVESLYYTGGALISMSWFEESLDYLDEALKLSRKIGNKKLEGEILSSVALAYMALYDNNKALEYALEADIVFQSVHRPFGTSGNYEKIAALYALLGKYSEAIDYYNRAYNIYVSGWNPYMNHYETSMPLSIGGLYQVLGQYGEAFQYYFMALENSNKRWAVAENYKPFTGFSDSRILTSVIDPNVLIAIGELFEDIEEYDISKNYYIRAFDLSVIMTDIDRKKVEAGTNVRLGRVLAKMGNMNGAQFYQEALKLYNEIGDKEALADVIVKIGSFYNQFAMYQKAHNIYLGSLQYYTDNNRTWQRANVALSMAINLRDDGKQLDALKYLDIAREVYEEENILEGLWVVYALIGEIKWKHENEPEVAVVYYEKSLEAIDKLFSNVSSLGEGVLQSKIEHTYEVFDEYIELLFKLHEMDKEKGFDKTAFMVSEFKKSIMFKIMLAESGIKVAIGNSKKSAALIEKESHIATELASLKNIYKKEASNVRINNDVLIDLKTKIAHQETLLRQVNRKIAKADPRYNNARSLSGVDIKGLQELLEDSETVVSYSMGSNDTYAFVMTNKSFDSFMLGVDPTELKEDIESLRDGVEGIENYEALKKFSPKYSYGIYNKIFKPIENTIEKGNIIYISADDVLYTLPFELLINKPYDKRKFNQDRKLGESGHEPLFIEYRGLHYLVDSHAIAYLPSVSVLTMLRKYKKKGYGKWSDRFIAFADPIYNDVYAKNDNAKDLLTVVAMEKSELTMSILSRATGVDGLTRLKEASEEAKAIAKELKVSKKNLYLRGKATEENVNQASLKDFKYILFSTHGLVGGDFRGVAEPSLALSLVGNSNDYDGFLSMSEVLALDVNAELVILSACNTFGKSEVKNGEGFAGLTRSFMYAGAKSVLITHWSVDSAAARDLMVKTFEYIDKKSGPEALRKSKINIKKSVRQEESMEVSLAHPFFWAPFVFVGDGGY